VKSVAADVAGNKFTNDSYVGTLANKGVLLASYHDLSSKVPALLQSEVRKIGNDIASGKQKIN
jgi:basic membrane protein A